MLRQKIGESILIIGFFGTFVERLFVTRPCPWLCKTFYQLLSAPDAFSIVVYGRTKCQNMWVLLRRRCRKIFVSVSENIWQTVTIIVCIHIFTQQINGIQLLCLESWWWTTWRRENWRRLLIHFSWPQFYKIWRRAGLYWCWFCFVRLCVRCYQIVEARPDTVLLLYFFLLNDL